MVVSHHMLIFILQSKRNIMNKHSEKLTELGLNWEVTKEPIQTVSGIEIPEKMAIMRSDTEQVLGIHGKNYDPYQNHELMELLHQIGGQTGLEVHTGGLFKGGAKVWFQLKSDDLRLNGDTIKGYLSGSTHLTVHHPLDLEIQPLLYPVKTPGGRLIVR